MVESQRIQPTGEQLSIVIGDECVCQAWWNYICQYSAGVHIFTMFIPASFFIYYKSVFSQFRLGGWVMK